MPPRSSRRRMASDGVTLVLEASVADVATRERTHRRAARSAALGKSSAISLLVAVGRAPNIERPRPRGGRRRRRQGRCHRRRSAAHVEPAHLRGRRRLLAVQVHACRRCRGADRDSERALLRPAARQRAGDSLVHLHGSRTGARRMSAEAARRQGSGVETITVPLDEVDRAVVDEERDGFVRVHHERGRMLGCTVVSSRAGEMIGLPAYALRRGASLDELGVDDSSVSDADQRVPHRRRCVSAARA